MTHRRDIACAICGLFACAHLAALGGTEAHERDALPAIEVTALPHEPEHDHQEFDRSLQFQAAAVTVSGTSSATLPPGRGLVSRPQRRARYNPGARYLGTPFILRSTSN